MVGAVGPEPQVGADRAHAAEHREQPDRLARPVCANDRHRAGGLEAHPLPARADEHGAAARCPRRRRGLQALGRAAGDVGDVVGGVDLVPDQRPERLGHQDEAAPRQHRQRRRRPVPAISPPQVPAALTTAPAAIAPRGVRTPVTRSPARWRPVTGSLGRTWAPWRLAAAMQMRRREHGLDLHVLGIEHPAGEARRPGAARARVSRSGATGRASTPAARWRLGQRGQRRRARPPSAATTRPPLGSSSAASVTAGGSSRHTRSESSASSSSGPGSLSETRMLPSPRTGRAAGDRAAIDDGHPQPRPGEVVGAGSADDSRADDDDVAALAHGAGTVPGALAHRGPTRVGRLTVVGRRRERWAMKRKGERVNGARAKPCRPAIGEAHPADASACARWWGWRFCSRSWRVALSYPGPRGAPPGPVRRPGGRRAARPGGPGRRGGSCDDAVTGIGGGDLVAVRPLVRSLAGGIVGGQAFAALFRRAIARRRTTPWYVEATAGC